jgi:hypothetical protein
LLFAALDQVRRALPGQRNRSCHKAAPKPFRWYKSADDISATIERFCTHNILDVI